MSPVLPTDVTHFATPAELREWFGRHGSEASELWIGMHKKASGRPSVDYRQALDEALCFGWIDGVRYKVDEDSFTQRFTPRKAKSYWSQVNTQRAHELIAAGLMTSAGLAAFELRDEAETERYSFEREVASFTSEQEQRFRDNTEAWEWFEKQPPSYRKPATNWVVSAKQEETRRRRLDRLIEDSAAGLRVGPLRRRDGR